MAISEEKIQIVIDNYFKSECNVDTSIREAFEKGFRIGTQKTAYKLTGEWLDKGTYAECSLCGTASVTQFDGVEPIPLKTKFCSNCGAYMRDNTDDDLIRRKDVLNLVGIVNGDIKMDIDERIKLYANICLLPNIKNVSSKGKWIESDIGWKCSECNYGVKPWNNTNFCPNCGSYMGEMENG